MRFYQGEENVIVNNPVLITNIVVKVNYIQEEFAVRPVKITRRASNIKQPIEWNAVNSNGANLQII